MLLSSLQNFMIKTFWLFPFLYLLKCPFKTHDIVRFHCLENLQIRTIKGHEKQYMTCIYSFLIYNCHSCACPNSLVIPVDRMSLTYITLVTLTYIALVTLTYIALVSLTYIALVSLTYIALVTLTYIALVTLTYCTD